MNTSHGHSKKGREDSPRPDPKIKRANQIILIPVLSGQIILGAQPLPKNKTDTIQSPLGNVQG